MLVIVCVCVCVCVCVPACACEHIRELRTTVFSRGGSLFKVVCNMSGS